MEDSVRAVKDGKYNDIDLYKGIGALFDRTTICTEPGALKNVASIARAAADRELPVAISKNKKGSRSKSEEELLKRGADIKSVKVIMDAFMAKDLQSVGIVFPSERDEKGGSYVTFLGTMSDCNDGLPLKITPKIREKAREGANTVSVEIDYEKDPLYVEVMVELENGNTGKAIIEGSHTNVTEIAQNGKLLFSNRGVGANSQGVPPVESDKTKLSRLSIGELYDIAQELDGEAYGSVKEAVKMNTKSMHRARKRNLFGLPDLKKLERDPRKRAEQYTRALVRERMEGVGPDVMAVCGSGNKGIETMSSLIAYSEANPKSYDELVKAAAFGCLVANKISGELGVLSSVCGCVGEAAPSVAAAMAFYRGASVKEIEESIKHVFNSVGGVVCTGAGAHSCPDKLQVGIGAAYTAVEKALQGDYLSPGGLIDKDLGKTLRNFGELARSMRPANEVIVGTMLKAGYS